MFQTIRIFGQKIAYGFGFGTGMCLAYTNADLLRVDISSLLNNIMEFNIPLEPVAPHVPLDNSYNMVCLKDCDKD